MAHDNSSDGHSSGGEEEVPDIQQQSRLTKLISMAGGASRPRSKLSRATVADNEAAIEAAKKEVNANFRPGVRKASLPSASRKSSVKNEKTRKGLKSEKDKKVCHENNLLPFY